MDRLSKTRPRRRTWWLAALVIGVTWGRTALAQPGVEPPADPPTTDSAADTTPEPPSEPPPTGPDDAEVEAMQKRIDELEARLEAIERRPPETAPPAPTEPAAPAPAPPQPTEPEPAKVVVDPGNGDADHNRPPDYADGFHFGSYGRVVAGAHHNGRAGRDGDIVARGSRLDETTYAELELRREDYWEAADAYTRIVATIAFASPLFHQTGNFAANLGVRNLYIEESGLGSDRLRVWAGSRMYRGDDIYLLDFWPLDNLNTVGGGGSYRFLDDLTLKLHAGINQPTHPFFLQTAQRPLPLGQLGETQVAINDRQKFISSARLSNIFKVGNGDAGIKPVIYGEVHYTSAAQREVTDRQFEDLPDDAGFVVGTQLGMFTGKRSTHLNLVFRYAGGLAAYGEFNAPTQLGADRTSKGAREILAAASGNFEAGPFGLLLGSYWRSFRNASESLDAGDLGEGIVILRPTLWLGKFAGVSLEGSYQAQRRGVLLDDGNGSVSPQFGQMGRVGLIPFMSPAGRGNFARPHLRVIYLLSVRDEGAQRLYPEHDVYSLRGLDHYIGFGAEWWFGSTSYFRD